MDALLTGEGRLVYDTIGLLSAEQIVALRERHAVKVLGRGFVGDTTVVPSVDG